MVTGQPRFLFPWGTMGTYRMGISLHVNFASRVKYIPWGHWKNPASAGSLLIGPTLRLSLLAGIFLQLQGPPLKQFIKTEPRLKYISNSKGDRGIMI